MEENAQRDPQTYAIIGAAQRVHAELGFGFYERVYQDALEIELRRSGIPFEREKAIQVFYQNTPLGSPYYVDFLCYDDILVELKAIARLSKINEVQVVHYLRATKKTRALLFNFGQPRLELIRFANGYKNPVEYSFLSEHPACGSTPQNLLKSASSALKKEGIYE